MFYLKDLLVKEGVTPQEKAETLFKLKRNVFKQVFGSAMKALLTEFERIKEAFIQVEVVQMIAISGNVQLIQPLRDILGLANIEQSVKEEIEDAIASLTIVHSNSKSFAMV